MLSRIQSRIKQRSGRLQMFRLLSAWETYSIHSFLSNWLGSLIKYSVNCFLIDSYSLLTWSSFCWVSIFRSWFLAQCWDKRRRNSVVQRIYCDFFESLALLNWFSIFYLTTRRDDSFFVNKSGRQTWKISWCLLPDRLKFVNVALNLIQFFKYLSVITEICFKRRNRKLKLFKQINVM